MLSKLDSNYPKRFAMQQTISNLIDQARDSYSMSIPLFASGILGDEKRFNESLLKINSYLKSMPDDGFKAWLYGRILLSAKSMKNEQGIIEAKNFLINYFDTSKEDRSAFATWAIGYLAAFNQDSFTKHKDQLLTYSRELTAKYVHSKSNNKNDPDKEQSDLSDAVWAWVMFLQAAAFADDKAAYEMIIGEINNISKQVSLAETLGSCLLRTKASNDYPAWALGIATLSAASMNDEVNYGQLKSATTDSLKIAAQVKTEEALLGELTLALAEKKSLEQVSQKQTDLSC